jgi:hypothetical protein
MAARTLSAPEHQHAGRQRRFNDWHGTWRTDVSAPVSFNTRVDVGDFYDGCKQSYSFGAAARPLVFNERRDSSTGGLLDRALVAKVTQMLAC